MIFYIAAAAVLLASSVYFLIQGIRDYQFRKRIRAMEIEQRFKEMFSKTRGDT